MGIKDMIARCIERMRAGACATCDNRKVCPAGRFQQAFPRRDPFAESPPSEQPIKWFFGFLRSLWIGEPRPAPCFKRQVEAAIEVMLDKGDVGIDRIADTLGMSRQTLYRRLRAEDVTFQEVLEAKRRQLAIRYLGIERQQAKAVAYRLGFSDPTAFSRAFKRWTGVSPSKFSLA